MKKAAVLLLLLQIFLSCKGQESKNTETAYTLKQEYGLKGSVKKGTTYIYYKGEDDKIPIKNDKYIGKVTMTFDNAGDPISINKLWILGSLGKSEFSDHYTGKGRALSYKETVRLYDGEFKENNYKFIWSDDYNYSILNLKDSTSSNFTLDKNYRILKCVLKNKDVIDLTEETETIYKNDKILEIKTKATENTDGKTVVSYRIQVVQEYDNNGNPTVIYTYADIGKQKIEHVLYKEYTYY
ncbi:hypothetical protein [Flavobacterium cerinum]|uniref:DUF4595 domain-containing protein n=1 Tax=Flavobacterium cerinum TaxID=2502784 RepID=A0ABY5IP50_9FLAO|nr:hypothetical protein [Flavobacterium cerinum]UUC44414.1 hypothetical protein NOX80_12310 [Flavobacterium cerinum]